jgi:hypothetical protein
MDFRCEHCRDDYVNLIQGMRFILAQIRRNIEMHWNEVDRLNKITDELEVDLLSFKIIIG